MKIFAVVRNYEAQESVLPFGEGSEPLWYEMPDSSLLHTRQPFFVPDFAENFRAMPTIAYRVSRLGKGIPERFASRYVDAWALACPAVAADMLMRLRADGRPWAPAIAFDKACMISDFMPLDDLKDYPRFLVSAGDLTLTYDTARIRNHFGALLSSLSRDNTVKNGDIMLAALHPSGLPLRPGMKLTVEGINIPQNDSNNKRILDINIR